MLNPQRAVRRRRPRVLIVEDEALIAQCLDELVRSLGWIVADIAHNLSSARTAIGTCRFDAALVDLRLGSELTTEIVDVLQERGTPIALVTGYDQALEPRHSAIPLLRKPFTEEQLRALLEDLLGPLQTDQLNALDGKSASSRRA
jgi:DNA-binding NtrC family response regulator